MKHIKIAFALMVVVLLAMGGVFLVEGYTTPIIEARLEAEANEALFEMFVDADDLTKITDTLPADDVVDEVYSMTDGGTQIGVVYKATFPGFNPGIVALLGVNVDDNSIAGFKVLTEGETAGLGKDLLQDPMFADQFNGLTIDEAKGGVDSVSGSTAWVTLGGVNTAVRKVLTYHGVNFLGEVVETPEMVIERLQNTWFEGETLTEVPSEGMINTIYESSNGGVFMIVSFNGYAKIADATLPDSRFVIGLNDGIVLGYETLDTTETGGIGYDLVMHDEFAAQFTGLNAEDLLDTGVDSVAGTSAPITLQAVNDSLVEAVGYYVVNYLGGEAPVVETPEMIQDRVMSEMFPDATFTDVTSDYAVSDYVWEMFEASTGGHVIVGIFNGYAPESLYVMGVKDGVILGYATLQTNETPGIGYDLVMHDEFAAQFIGLSVEDVISSGVDSVAGVSAPMTLNGFNESVQDVLDFYNKEVLGVQDTTPPTITLKETAVLTYAVGSTHPNYINLVDASDNDALASITSDGESVVDLNTAGDYTVTYTATDEAGNETTFEVLVTVVAGEVELEIVEPSAEVLTALQELVVADYYHTEPETSGNIVGIYTARDANKDVVAVFYQIESNNGGWSSPNENYTLLQFEVDSATVLAVSIYDGNSTYTQATGTGSELKDLDASLIVSAITTNGALTTDDLDSISGTTAMFSFPSLVASIEEAIQYQTDNNIGGSN